MTAIKGTKTQRLVDEFNFSSETSGFGVTVAMSEQECTNLASTAMAYAAILPSVQIEQSGYVITPAATGTLEAELQARLGVAGSYVAALLGTDTAGCPAYVQNTFNAAMNITAPATGLMTLVGTWGKGSGGSRGIRIYSGEATTEAATTAVDLGAAGSAGGVCYLFVQDIDGSATDATLIVQSSATEGGTYAAEATFEFSAVGGYAAAMTGTVNRWLRVDVDSLGGADGITFVMIACVDGVTQ
jgi:hypothetical protein